MEPAGTMPGNAQMAVGTGMMFFFVLIVLLLYVFGCYVMKRICEKAGHEPGILIWIPIVQVVPIFAAANMNLVWIVGFFIPVANFVVTIILWIKLCEALGKPSWMGVLIMVPIANFVLPLYLAFGD